MTALRRIARTVYHEWTVVAALAVGLAMILTWPVLEAPAQRREST